MNAKVAVALVALLIAVPTVGMAAELPTRTADLAIEEPPSADGSVETQQVNGTTRYIVEGARIDIVPQNFAAEDVLDAGVVQRGNLSYDPKMGQFHFRPSTTGTYRLFWVVSEEVPAEGPNATGTETVQVRYEAEVRVTGGVNIATLPADRVADLRTAANRWQSFNSTLHSETHFGPDADTDRAIDTLFARNTLFSDPVGYFTDEVPGILLILVTTVAGLTVVAVFLGWHQRAVTSLARRLNMHEATEAAEGTAREALAELEHQERQFRAEDLDPADVFADDHIAEAWRETFGQNMREGTIEYLSAIRPRNIVQQRLQAAGQCGWIGVVDEWAATDGGTDERVPASITLKRADAVGDDADTISLTEPENVPMDAVLDAVDWDASPLYAFDLPAADFDPHESAVEYTEHDLETLVERFETDMRHFSDEETYGTYLLEFVEAVREHPLTDDRGDLDDLQYTMEAFLRHAELFDERYGWPTIHYVKESIQRALVTYNADDAARRRIDQFQQRGGAD